MKKKRQLGEVFHSSLQGRREYKYENLNASNLKLFDWKKIKCSSPNFFFVPRNSDSEEKYSEGFSINDILLNSNSGIQTKNDGLTINIKRSDLEKVVADFRNLTIDDLKLKYSLNDTSGWTAKKAKEDVLKNKGSYYKIYYRPFDVRNIYMTEKSGGFVGRPRLDTMRHFFNGDNVGLITVRQQSTFSFQHILVSNTLMESGAISLQTKEWGYIYPLYVYPLPSSQQTTDQLAQRTPNLNIAIVNKIAEQLNLTFSPEKETTEGTFSPIDILDYIYAVLHSPTYREKYKEFLKIDFPRVPYPKDTDTFWQLVKLGGRLRQIHLLERPVVNKFITQYPIDGDNIVEKVKYHDSKVYINDQQYFANVPQGSWEFYIGGYQPAQKWLKDRKGRKLEFDDILHYQKIIVALTETARLMNEIDGIEIE
jgi:predicted helicase